jgi:hypothetical protein
MVMMITNQFQNEFSMDYSLVLSVLLSFCGTWPTSSSSGSMLAASNVSVRFLLERLHFGLAVDRIGGRGDFLVAVRIAEHLKHAHLSLHQSTVDHSSQQPGVTRHIGFRHHVPGVDQVNTVPVITVTPADSRQVRAGALGTPLERAVVYRLACHGKGSVTFGFTAKRPDHLGVAVVATFPDVYVPAGELQCRIGLDAFIRRPHLVLKNQGQYFNQAAQADHDHDEYGHQDDVLL